MTTVAVLVGSLRKESFSRKVANAVVKLTPGLKFEFLDIGGVSYFNQDLEANPPSDWTAFRDRIKAADAVLFVTAEYNRSVPGVLKNALDVASRPYGQGALMNKPAAVISTIIAINFAWVAASLYVAFGPSFTPTLAGRGFVLAQGVMVFVFAELQIIGLRRGGVAA